LDSIERRFEDVDVAEEISLEAIYILCLILYRASDVFASIEPLHLLDSNRASDNLEEDLQYLRRFVGNIPWEGSNAVLQCIAHFSWPCYT
jgi:hypothetical protein